MRFEGFRVPRARAIQHIARIAVDIKFARRAGKQLGHKTTDDVEQLFQRLTALQPFTQFREHPRLTFARSLQIKCVAGRTLRFLGLSFGQFQFIFLATGIRDIGVGDNIAAMNHRPRRCRDPTSRWQLSVNVERLAFPEASFGAS